jgi:predicted component of type VI protein secretion system
MTIKSELNKRIQEADRILSEQLNEILENIDVTSTGKVLKRIITKTKNKLTKILKTNRNMEKKKATKKAAPKKAAAKKAAPKKASKPSSPSMGGDMK